MAYYIFPFLCKVCGETEEDKFYKTWDKEQQKYYYKKSICKECHSKERSLYAKQNSGQWEDCRTVESRRAYKRNANLVKNYGITQLDYDQMLKDQNFQCACCGDPWEYTDRHWPVEHNHVTGKVRGITCAPCNKTIGYAKDSVDRLQAAINYLKKEVMN